MLTVLNCLVTLHDYRFVGAALAICAFGCLISIRLFASARAAHGGKRGSFVLMSGIVAGMTIWTTHFLAMLGFMPDFEHGFDPEGTLFSLVAAVLFSIGAVIVAASRKAWFMPELGGAAMGCGVAAMHFLGMSAFIVPGHLEYDSALVAASVLLGAALGALAFNRVTRPVTRFCRYGAATALALAIGTMHFTAMGAVRIVPDPRIEVPPQLLSDTVLAILVVSVTGLVVMLAAITYFADRQSSEDALSHYRHLAMHDVLTGLPNRAAAREELVARLARGDDATFAVMAVDLNRFKEINDVYGHAAGDTVLVEATARMSALLKKGEFFGRVGGDEFVAYRSFGHSAEIEEFAVRIGEAFGGEVRIEGCSVAISASIGIAVFPKDGRTIDELNSRADLAMYRAKEMTDGDWCWYDVDADEDGRRRGQIAIGLRNGLAAGELSLVFQPQVSVRERKLLGFEALLRWTSAELGTVPPADFIPVAEQTGLIVDIGDWVMLTACRAAASWPGSLTIAVNVSPMQILRPNFSGRVREILAETGLDPRQLEIEITETTLIENPGQAMRALRALKAMGIRIAMDDFGTGYSSLSTMFSFPFDKLKVDRGFLLDFDRRPQAASVIETVIELGHKLSIPVLAEGVETDTQADFLLARHCDEAQGYLFGRPLSLEAASGLARDPASVAAAQRPVELAKVA
jgi:diguanylate cyclase (GGDEF)-like protein